MFIIRTSQVWPPQGSLKASLLDAKARAAHVTSERSAAESESE